jgi:hypothetical protein
MLAAPRCSFCALAGNAKAPNTKTAALNVSESFLIKAFLLDGRTARKEKPSAQSLRDVCCIVFTSVCIRKLPVA